MALEQVAFDIETTGLEATDQVTVAGFALPMGVRVFCQTAGRDAGGVATTVDEEVPTTVSLSTHDTEQALFRAVNEFAERQLCGQQRLLVAYNGDTWQGGFDLPFWRTRATKLRVPWPFMDVPYADLVPLVSKRFNTTLEGDEAADLETAYEVLCDGEYSALDPFTDSAAAVTAFDRGEFPPLVLHNIADILRTRAVGQLTERYCAKSEYQVKSLTPVADE